MAQDEFKASFVVDLDDEAVWELLARTVDGVPERNSPRKYLIPGFPSLAPTAAPGAMCTEIEAEPGRLLRVKKDGEPCAGTEIIVVLEQADRGTRVTVTQSGFGSWFKKNERTITALGMEIIADMQLYLQSGYRAPPKNWGVPFGAETTNTDVGLVIESLSENGPLAKAGLVVGDLLITFRRVRILRHPPALDGARRHQTGR